MTPYLALPSTSFRSIWTDFNPFETLLSYPERLAPRFEVEDGDNAFVLTLPLPGFKRGEVQVEVDRGNVLTVRASKGDKAKVQHYTEVSRSLTLGESADAANVTARLEDGVLHISVPKRDLPKPRRIEIA